MKISRFSINFSSFFYYKIAQTAVINCEIFTINKEINFALGDDNFKEIKQ